MIENYKEQQELVNDGCILKKEKDESTHRLAEDEVIVGIKMGLD